MSTNYERLVATANENSSAPNHDPDLPNQMRQRVIEVADELRQARQSTDPSSTDYLKNLGQLNMDRLIAEEIVRDEMLPPPNDDDQLLPPELPADPNHPLNDPEILDKLSIEEYRTLYAEWLKTPEAQQPASIPSEPEN